MVPPDTQFPEASVARTVTATHPLGAKVPGAAIGTGSRLTAVGAVRVPPSKTSQVVAAPASWSPPAPPTIPATAKANAPAVENQRRLVSIPIERGLRSSTSFRQLCPT